MDQNSSDDSYESIGFRHNYIHAHPLKKMTGLFHRPHQKAYRDFSLPTNSDISPSSIEESLPAIKPRNVINKTRTLRNRKAPPPSQSFSSLESAAGNVQFTNVRSTDKNTGGQLKNESSFPDDQKTAAASSSSGSNDIDSASTITSTTQPFGSSGMNTSTSRFGKLISRTASRWRRQQPANDSDQSSIFTLTSHGGRHSGSTSDRPPQLQIQTSLLPFSSRETKSPLVKTSKEVERIAAYSNANTSSDRLTLNGNQSQQNKNWASKYRSRHLLRSLKDTIKSSANSNSQFTPESNNETRYSFRPMGPNGSMTTTGGLQSILEELQQVEIGSNNDPSLSLQEDRDAVASEAWTIFCSLVTPLFEGGKLQAPVEEINKLVYLHMKLCVDNSNQMASPRNDSDKVVYARMDSPASPFIDTGLESLETLTPVPAGQGKMIEEIKVFLKNGMNTLKGLLYYDDRSQSVKIDTKVSSRKFNPLILGSNADFETSCYLLWDVFYNHIYYYLQGVFLPLREGDVSFSDNSNPNKQSMDVSISDIILESFRNQIVIPFYQLNRQLETEHERRREFDTSLSPTNINFIGMRKLESNSDGSSAMSSPQGKHQLNSKTSLQSETMKRNYNLYESLLQCFTILNSVQTNDTNQKIVENLMQQMREKCLISRPAE